MADQIRAAKLARLDALELQAAQMGINTPPHITNEIRDLRRDLGLLQAVSNPLLERGMEEVKDYLLRVLQNVEIAINTGTKNTERLSRLEQQYNEDKHDREGRQQHQDEIWDEFRDSLYRNWVTLIAVAVIGGVFLTAIMLYLILVARG